MLVDSDLWLCALDLAVLHGWQPTGTLPASAAPRGGPDTFAYHEPGDRRISGEDAQELARCLEEALKQVSDTAVPMQGRAFGEENTLELIQRAAGGHQPREENALAAREILSGPPKKEARDLLGFLRTGEFTIQASSAGVGGPSTGHG